MNGTLQKIYTIPSRDGAHLFDFHASDQGVWVYMTEFGSGKVIKSTDNSGTGPDELESYDRDHRVLDFYRLISKPTQSEANAREVDVAALKAEKEFKEEFLSAGFSLSAPYRPTSVSNWTLEASQPQLENKDDPPITAKIPNMPWSPDYVGKTTIRRSSLIGYEGVDPGPSMSAWGQTSRNLSTLYGKMAALSAEEPKTMEEEVEVKEAETEEGVKKDTAKDGDNQV